MKKAMDSHKSEVPDFLHEALLNHYAKESRQVQVSQEFVVTRSFSTVRFLEVMSGNTTNHLVAKTITPHEVNRAFWENDNQATVEFNILQNLYPKFLAVPNCSVPEPLLLLAEHSTYIMHFVPGNLLDTSLKQSRNYGSFGKWEKTREHHFSTGKWLRNLQTFTGFTFEGDEALVPLTNRMVDSLKELHLKSDDLEFARKLEAQMHEIFLTQTERLRSSGEKLPVCGRHGDFGAWNIIVNDDGVTVIDFMGYGRDPAVMDFVKMLISLYDYEEIFAYRTSRIKVLREAFVSGYASSQTTPEPVWVMCEAYYRLCSIIACQKIAHLRWDKRRMKKNILKKHLDWFANLKARQTDMLELVDSSQAPETSL